MPRALVAPIAIAATVASLALSCGGARTRDLDCEREQNGRRREICAAIADHLKLAWGGSNRAMTPAYLLSAHDLRGVYCDARLSTDDEPLLAAIESERREPRLASAAGQLRHLVAPGPGDRGTRYDPAHPRHYLKESCPPPYSARRR